MESSTPRQCDELALPNSSEKSLDFILHFGQSAMFLSTQKRGELKGVWYDHVIVYHTRFEARREHAKQDLKSQHIIKEAQADMPSRKIASIAPMQNIAESNLVWTQQSTTTATNPLNLRRVTLEDVISLWMCVCNDLGFIEQIDCDLPAKHFLSRHFAKTRYLSLSSWQEKLAENLHRTIVLRCH